jgi:FeS assembly SUF system regulator
MLRLSKLTDYSTVIMFYMARRSEHVCSAAEIATAVGLAVPTTSKILKLLARQGLLLSRRGSSGGYVLARPPERISIAQIIEAMEGRFGMTECSTANGLCPQESACMAREPWQFINQAIRRTLDQVTLADVANNGIQPVALDGLRARMRAEA